MSIGFFPRYSEKGASSRCRFYMYFKHWLEEEPDRNIFIRSGLSDKYLEKLYKHGRVSRFTQAVEFLRMLLRSLSLPEKLLIEYELVPFLAYKYEKKLLKNRPYILNIDDNIWEKYRNCPRLENKYHQLCSGAAGIIVANDFLFNKVSVLNKNICLIPTVIDLDKYHSAAVEKFDVFTAAWIGTPVTYKYLEDFQDILQFVFNTPQRKLLVIADKELQNKRPLKNVNAEYVTWSEERECEYLKQCHAGIMPLTDDEFSKGKSAYKLLQYQGAGLPLIASPVGENKHVVKNGVNGFLVENKDQWLKAFEELQFNKDLYEKFSAAAAADAYDYSFQKYFPVFKEFVIKTFV